MHVVGITIYPIPSTLGAIINHGQQKRESKRYQCSRGQRMVILEAVHGAVQDLFLRSLSRQDVCASPPIIWVHPKLEYCRNTAVT